MFKYYKNGVSVTSILDKRHLHLDGTYAVKIRVGFKSQAWYYPANVNLTCDKWEKLPAARNCESVRIREIISESYNHVKVHVDLLVAKEIFSFKNLKLKIKGTKKESLNSILEEKINELRNTARIGSMKYYETVLTNLQKYSFKNVPLDDVDASWLEKYDSHLRKTRSHTTVMMNLRGIRTAINMAIKQGLIGRDKYPFGEDGYTFRITTGRKKALSMKQIKSICEFQSDNKEIMKSRDLFLFMYLCNGITTDDLIELKYSNIYDDEICFVRGKTKNMTHQQKEIRAVITNEMRLIIRRWGSRPRGDNYIFPLLKRTNDPLKRYSRKHTFNKVFNSNLKIIAEVLGIPKFTTYSARHSFATTMKRSGVSIAYISDSLGHTSLVTTQSYLDSFEKETREKNSRLLLQFA